MCWRTEIEVPGQARAVPPERRKKAGDAFASRPEVMDVEIQVEQVDVPRRLGVFAQIGFDDSASDRQRAGLRIVVDVSVVGCEQLGVLLVEQAIEARASEAVSRADTGVRI